MIALQTMKLIYCWHSMGGGDTILFWLLDVILPIRLFIAKETKQCFYLTSDGSRIPSG